MNASNAICQAHWGTSSVQCYLPEGHSGDHAGRYGPENMLGGICRWPNEADAPVPPPVTPPDWIGQIHALNVTLRRLNDSVYEADKDQREMIYRRISEISDEIRILSQNGR